MRVHSFRAVMGIALVSVSIAQESGIPREAPPTPAIVASKDIPYPGKLTLAVDATDLDRRIFRVTETVPVAAPGRLTLLFPRWLPGDHSPTGSLDQLTGLVINAAGKRLEWVRDTVEVSAFHVIVPDGVKQLDLQFQFTSPTETKYGRVVVTPEMLNLQWNQMLLYPAGYYVSRIPIDASVTLPAGWKFGGALEPIATENATTRFKTVSLETLVDSPLFAGKHYRQFDLAPGADTPVRLNLFADKASSLEVKPEGLAAHRALVQQAYKLFNAHHYNHYDFLLALTDNLGGIGLEHHQSSENSLDTNTFTEWEKSFVGRELLAHELTHSWNGKFRRPADLWTPDFTVPMRDSLLWVYEGQTEYWGYVLAVRAGLLKKQQTLDGFAEIAAYYDNSAGRSWRALQDTTNDPTVTRRAPLSWVSWQRSEDYYAEGALIWLEADTLIREQTKGAKSLDDFARAFFGIADGSITPVTYVFEDVVAALNQVLPYDWTTFLRTRLDGHSPSTPLESLRLSGYKLVYRDTPSELATAVATSAKRTSFWYSLGFSVSNNGNELTSVRWDGPAFKAGLIPGTKLVALNGKEYDSDDLKEAITAAAQPDARPIELLVKSGDRYRTVNIEYHAGLRYPHLERIEGSPALLDDILTPRP